MSILSTIIFSFVRTAWFLAYFQQSVIHYSHTMVKNSSSIQVAIYFYDENQIIKECISKKMIFEANDMENNPQFIYLAVFNHDEVDNSISLLIRRNKIDYFFNFVYDNYDFDLLYHNETDKNDYFRYFKQINFREKKIIITKKFKIRLKLFSYLRV